nr:polysaccharide deacetylase family protein [Neobacillus sp. Marseille-Q6967]
MTEILLIFTILLFSIFLVLGIVSHFKFFVGKWIYFTISVLSFIAFVFMLFFLNFNFSDQGTGSQNEPPKTEVPSGNNGDDPGKEDPPDEENPAPEEPVNETPADPEPIEPEEIVIHENGTVDYKVVAGDTLWSIAMRAGVTVEKIKQWNNLTSDTIYIGQILKLYGKNVEPPPLEDPPKQEDPPTTASSVIITNGNLQEKQIALTFDAGSDAIGIGILDVLKKHNVKATFFLTGSWADKFPQYAKRIASDGHEIGNHSYSHPDAVKTNSNIFKQDIIKAEEAIKNATGVTPQPYFRFPYGSYNNAALKIVGEAGYPYSIHWTIDTIDWKQPSVEVIVSRIQSGASNGDIILMHIGGINTPEAVDQVIPILKQMGYELVILSEILNLE